jgi:lipid-binding SYLF domain-containing protein
MDGANLDSRGESKVLRTQVREISFEKERQRMKKVFAMFVSCALVAGLGCSGKQVHNSDRPDQSARAANSEVAQDRQEVLDRLQDSSKVLTDLMETPESTVPEWVLSKAQCVMVVPSMIKGGFIVGGRHGRGAATCKNNGRWSAPQMVTITGGSWGAQIGAAAVDLVLVFVGNKGAQDLLANNVKISGDVTVAAGPFGRTAQAATDMSINAEILAYSKARGLFAGAELGGASVRSDDDSNRALYGRETTSRQVLTGAVPVPESAEPFMTTVRKEFREAIQAH